MKTNYELRSEARKTFTNSIFSSKWMMAFITYVIMSLIFSVPGIASAGILSIVGIFLSGTLWGGFTYGLLNLFRNDESMEIKGLFKYFSSKHFVRYMVIGLLELLYKFLWFSLFVIPGIIKHYSYALTYYIAIDNPELEGNDVITKSRKMMDGHKFDLFILDLTFIGWFVLSLFTLGLGFFWLIPYIKQSHTAFYEDLLKSEKLASIEQKYNQY